VNAQDNVGNTPLHLAVRSADHFPNTRSIKELLIKGASRDITEENGLKPIDLVDEIEDEQKKRELAELLKDPGFYIPCCHFR
jgi:ankyrin repeat protein